MGLLLWSGTYSPVAPCTIPGLAVTMVWQSPKSNDVMGIEGASPSYTRLSVVASAYVCSDYHSASQNIIHMLAQQKVCSAYKGLKLCPAESMDVTQANVSTWLLDTEVPPNRHIQQSGKCTKCRLLHV